MKVVTECGGHIKHVQITDEKVLPCPFCGSTDIELCNTHAPSYWLECQGCGAQAHGEGFGDKGQNTKAAHVKAAKSALAAWNKRVETSYEQSLLASKPRQVQKR